mgnify:CR=1 FL=1
MRTRNLGGRQVSEIGFGAMNLSLAGRAPDDELVNVIHAALDAGVTLIDTADAYCIDDADFHHNETVIRKALDARPGSRDSVFVATKAGYRRPGGAWVLDGNPAYIRQTIDDSLRALGVEQIDLLQLHGVDPNVPLETTMEAIADAKRTGKARLIGLSNVSVDQIERASKVVEIVSVQNEYSPFVLKPEQDGVLQACAERGMAFLPWGPLGGRSRAKEVGTKGAFATVAERHDVSPQRVVLAWQLAKWPALIQIPGGRRVESVLDSLAAAELDLTSDEVSELSASLAQ